MPVHTSRVSVKGSLRAPFLSSSLPRVFPLSLHLDSNRLKLNDLHKHKGLSSDACAIHKATLIAHICRESVCSCDGFRTSQVIQKCAHSIDK